MYDRPNDSVSSDLEWPLTYISRSRVIIDALDVLRAQLTRDLFAIAKFLFFPMNQLAAWLTGDVALLRRVWLAY